MSNESEGPRWWVVVKEIAVPIVFVGAGVLISHETRLTAIEASRYTPTMALERERSVNLQINTLERQIALMAGDLSVVRQILEDMREER